MAAGKKDGQMPGPMSAPNGNVFLTFGRRDPKQTVKTGKTAKKRKGEETSAHTKQPKFNRTERQRQEEA